MTDGSVLKGARGTVLTLVGQAIKIAIQFISVVTLSRILPPSDFGLMAILLVFIALGELLRDFGMSTIGIQRRHLSHQQASNLFWLNTALGGSCMVVLAASAPLLPSLFGTSALTELAQVLSVTLLLNGASTQFQVQLARQMRFAAIITRDIISATAGLVVAVISALSGHGVWSLVFAALTTSSATFTLGAALSRWRPARPARDPSSRGLFKDGATFGISHFLAYLSANVDTIALGIQFSATSLGIYNRAYQIVQLPISRLISPLSHVVISTTNRATTNGRRADEILGRFQFALGLPIVCTFAIVMATADWLIPFLLGEEWAASAPLGQIMAAGGMFWFFNSVTYWRVVHNNLGARNVYFNLVVNAAGIAAIIAGSFIALWVVACAVTFRLFATWLTGTIWFRGPHWDTRAYILEGAQLIVPGIVSGALGILLYGALPSTGMSALATALIVVCTIHLGICLTPGGLWMLRQNWHGMMKTIKRRTSPPMASS